MPDNRWETFARENPEYYIYTAPDVDFTSPQGQALFLRSGRVDAEQILRESLRSRAGNRRAVEIGCGVGRLALPMSERFDEVIGVDVAPSMLRGLADYCGRAGVENVRGMLPHEPWDRQGEVDFGYSLIVFQHIESEDVVADYLRRLAGCLRRDGVFYAQFDARPASLPYMLLRALPDVVLPRAWRKGVRRVRRRRADLLRLFASCGLTVAAEFRSNSERQVFLLRPG